ncbi:hypothetical protein SAMN05216431_10272 [Ligilactobacillus sp. WC1T17]|uniref:Probable membrane transporter protein n=1 Tax=Ligilactobacillus ruminis TaxID=1623 RepID=A0ABY1A9J6_9LACO|nr:hypothetical protein SAMN05216431_10272 [Ligilactobacillus ruminis]
MHLIIFNLELIVVGLLAGIVSTAAGLASLVSYPALLMLGLSPVMANVTNTFGTITSSFSSVITSLPELKKSVKQLLYLIPITFIGAIMGSLLLFMLPGKTFQNLVPLFMLLAAFMLLKPGKKAPAEGEFVKIEPSFLKKALSFGGIFIVSIYQGYFGAGSGALLLALMMVIYSDKTFAENNALKNASAGLTNVISIIIYATKTTILWGYVLPMAIGFFVGGILGPMIARRVPQKIMKTIVGLGAILLAIVLFFRNH